MEQEWKVEGLTFSHQYAAFGSRVEFLENKLRAPHKTNLKRDQILFFVTRRGPSSRKSVLVAYVVT